MLSYHNDPAIKQKYIQRFEAHRAADEVIQGTGFSDGRGCFVGCTLDSYDHSRFPEDLGWPEWLAYLADKIFEGIPQHEAAQFGSDLLSSVPVGVDLAIVRPLLCIARMDRLLLLHRNCDDYGLKDALLQVKQFHEMEVNKTSTESAARSAAWSAAESAESAAWSAARSAWSAAWSAAESAAWSAARSAAESAFQIERDMLLKILRELEL